MLLSYISAILLASASLAIASPISTPDVPSLSPRQQTVSQNIMSVVDESRKVKTMCQSYEAGLIDSIQLYRQFKKCHKAGEHAGQAAKHSKPFDAGESEKVKAALAQLTREFGEISKALCERSDLIKKSRYQSYIVKELESLKGSVKTFYGNCHAKVTSPYKPKVQSYASEADTQFEKVKKALSGSSKALGSLEAGAEEEEFRGPVERIHLSHFHPWGKSLEQEKRSPIATSEIREEPEEAVERFHFPWAKRGEKEFVQHLPAMVHTFLAASTENGDKEAVILPVKTGLSYDQAKQSLNTLMSMLSSLTADSQAYNNKNETQIFLDHVSHGLTSMEDVKRRIDDTKA